MSLLRHVALKTCRFKDMSLERCKTFLEDEQSGARKKSADIILVAVVTYSYFVLHFDTKNNIQKIQELLTAHHIVDIRSLRIE